MQQLDHNVHDFPKQNYHIHFLSQKIYNSWIPTYNMQYLLSIQYGIASKLSPE